MRLFATVILALACTVWAEDIPEVDDSVWVFFINKQKFQINIFKIF